MADPKPNLGAQITLRALTASNRSKRGLEKALNAPRGIVSHWLASRQKPTTRYRVLLETAIGTPIEAWDKPALGRRRKRKPSPSETSSLAVDSASASAGDAT